MFSTRKVRYNWCIEVIKTSNLSWLASELELNKALVYLRQNDVNQAIETLQMYDRKSEGSMTASALTNLTFIYINYLKLNGVKVLSKLLMGFVPEVISYSML
ncbi:hypothetical protein FF38_02065 [Lucilia cuprina]|uniref:Uncharacterized protein n=1 Tax=Lucilia cuprina TaxID=7375 RepID=A0A0L0C4M4_LUCCU|nr:hypothetical protein FF38_02065 [Lucilia cuprina]